MQGSRTFPFLKKNQPHHGKVFQTLNTKEWFPMARVLIVEDYPDTREILRIILESQGYVCEEAENGVQALSKVEGVSYDLVLLDYEMPHMNGFQFMEKAFSLKGPFTIPVIMMTGHATERVRIQALKSGAVDILAKPYDLDTLLTVIPQALVRQKVPKSCVA
jgi:CheY-like chemotaxis protein